MRTKRILFRRRLNKDSASRCGLIHMIGNSVYPDPISPNIYEHSLKPAQCALITNGGNLFHIFARSYIYIHVILVSFTIHKKM